MGQKYHLIADDPVRNAMADAFADYSISQVFDKVAPIVYSNDYANRELHLVNAINYNVVTWFDKLAEHLQANPSGRFLCGDSLTIHDFIVGGLLVNFVCNKNTRDWRVWADTWERAAPERVREYYGDFTEEMKEYLEGRS